MLGAVEEVDMRRGRAESIDVNVIVLGGPSYTAKKNLVGSLPGCRRGRAWRVLEQVSITEPPRRP